MEPCKRNMANNMKMGKYMPIKHLHCGSVKFFEMISTFDFDVGTRFSLPKVLEILVCFISSIYILSRSESTPLVVTSVFNLVEALYKPRGSFIAYYT